MKSYEVRVRIVGWAHVEVEADSEVEAIVKACQECTSDDFEDWDAVVHQSEATCCDEEDDDGGDDYGDDEPDSEDAE